MFLAESVQDTDYKEETTQQKGGKSCYPQNANMEFRIAL